MFKGKYWLPFAVFILLSVFLGIGLGLKPREIPSVFINKPAPPFTAKTLMQPGEISNEDLLGRVWVMNVWASWCVACRQEHPLFNQLATEVSIPIIGLNYKDEVPAAQTWLAELGNPYTTIATDTSGDIGIDYGVYGVPETFVIDHQGVIRYKHIGPVTVQDMQKVIKPLLASLSTQVGS